MNEEAKLIPYGVTDFSILYHSYFGKFPEEFYLCDESASSLQSSIPESLLNKQELRMNPNKTELSLTAN